MAHADWIIDLGPGAGHDGGRIVFEGPPAELVASRATLTGTHLAAYVGREGPAHPHVDGQVESFRYAEPGLPGLGFGSVGRGRPVSPRASGQLVAVDPFASAGLVEAPLWVPVPAPAPAPPGPPGPP